MHQFKAEQFLKIEIREAWKFFSSPKNLALITPPDMGFKILTTLDSDEIYDGMIIDYNVKPIMGIPLHWQTQICLVKPNDYFTDIQKKGPYKIWEHTHFFKQVNGGVIMTDVVNYKLPLGLIGRLMNTLFIRKKIENIFSFRKKVLENMFNKEV